MPSPDTFVYCPRCGSWAVEYFEVHISRKARMVGRPGRALGWSLFGLFVVLYCLWAGILILAAAVGLVTLWGLRRAVILWRGEPQGRFLCTNCRLIWWYSGNQEFFQQGPPEF